MIKRRSLLAGALTTPFLTSCNMAAPQVSPQQGGANASKSKPHDFETRLRPTVYPADTARPAWTLAERMSHYKVPGIAVAILKGGKIVHTSGYGTRKAGTNSPVTSESMFSVGSISKVITAAITLRLVSNGVLNLDKDISAYLHRWSVPAGPKGDTTPITLRMLMSHTAGFNVHGFADFAPGEPKPTLVQILNGTSPAKSASLKRMNPAGERMAYSGGGVMVEQMVLEDATNASLETLLKKHLLEPLGLTHSTFSDPPPAHWEDIANAHDGEGNAAALPRGWESFPEQAASGYWTSAGDLAKFAAALISSYKTNGEFLPQLLTVDMMTRILPGNYGLGPRVSGVGKARIFHHGGSNSSYKSYLEGNLVTGDGLVVLTNGSGGRLLAREIRAAVSDSMDWPGDYSVETLQWDEALNPSDLTGVYQKRGNMPLNSEGILNYYFNFPSWTVTSTGRNLQITPLGGEQPLTLLPVSSSRFVAPQEAFDATTIQFEFQRGADGKISSLVVDSGAGEILYNKRSSDKK